MAVPLAMCLAFWLSPSIEGMYGSSMLAGPVIQCTFYMAVILHISWSDEAVAVRERAKFLPASEFSMLQASKRRAQRNVPTVRLRRSASKATDNTGSAASGIPLMSG